MLRRNITEETCSRIIYFANKQSLKDGICIHSPMLKLGVRDNLLLTNNLLSLYVKCCGAQHARHLFDEMPHRDVVSWTSLLSAYVKDGNHREALAFFDFMKSSGENPNEFTFSNVLTSCRALGDFVYATRVHASLIRHGFGSNTILCTSLIDLYSQRGMLRDAVQVFDGVANVDSISWTAMISSFVQAGSWLQAVRCFIRMIDNAVPPNEYTFVKLLVACSCLGIDHVKLIHSQLILWGAPLNLVLKTALVYAKCQQMEEASKVLKQTSEQDVQLWTTVICGFTQNMSFLDAVTAFRHMVGNNIVPNGYCYAGILNACSSAQSLLLGRQIHAQVIMAGLENDVSLGNALLDLYAKCSDAVADVKRVFEGIALPNVVSWTTLIAGLAEQGLPNECCLAFLEMRLEGQQPNSFTLWSVLQACGATGSANDTGKVHGFIIKTNADHDIAVVNALVDAYAGLHMAACALRLVKGTSSRNVATYTVLASKLNRIGQHRLTLEIINHMRDDGLQIDGFVISTFLSASANLGAARSGEQLHGYAIRSGFAGWISVLNGLINLYGKCRCVAEAERAFTEVCQPNTISWNALMHGFALSGCTASALSTLEDMRLAGARPDSVTLMMVLYICGEGGLVDLALDYFHSLRRLYDIKPRLNHYSLLVDLLGRAGRLEEAVGMLNSMPLRPNALIYKRLLHSCRLHRNMLLAEQLARKGLQLDPCDLEFYHLLATIYDEGGRSDLGDTMRNLVKEGGGMRKNATRQRPLVEMNLSSSWQQKCIESRIPGMSLTLSNEE
uniref:Pentatricopeptide repeat protein n=1 Tax=Salvia miltiorrhiza TaxID=226208 RepID=A0A678WD91_SALMI|nr:pentatricopeptide repeat protein [Salvia miltiorrhiza]